MGFIAKDQPEWWEFAVELAGPGLWPLGIITTHGPREPPANKMWGNETAAGAEQKAVGSQRIAVLISRDGDTASRH